MMSLSGVAEYIITAWILVCMSVPIMFAAKTTLGKFPAWVRAVPPFVACFVMEHTLFAEMNGNVAVTISDTLRDVLCAYAVYMLIHAAYTYNYCIRRYKSEAQRPDKKN